MAQMRLAALALAALFPTAAPATAPVRPELDTAALIDAAPTFLRPAPYEILSVHVVAIGGSTATAHGGAIECASAAEDCYAGDWLDARRARIEAAGYSLAHIAAAPFALFSLGAFVYAGARHLNGARGASLSGRS
jgi:hypothetical protein